MINDPWLSVLILFVGFALDAAIGDPYHWPHPIKWFGNAIHYGETKLNNGSRRQIKGAMLTLLLVSMVYVLFWAMFAVIKPYTWVYFVVSIVFVFFGLANRTLINEGLKVEKELRINGVEAGREQLKYIVGRDTSQLSAQQIRMAVLETLAENLSDGVIAPLFYYAIGGVPAMFAYKMINTLDSMIGYKNERYIDFGKFAARLDDVANYIPARITAFLMVLITFSRRGLLFVFKYGNQHSSPNAGYPESALAGILNCRFGGPNVYHGKLVDKPYIGSLERELQHADVNKTCYINASTALVMVCLISLLYLFLK